MPVRKIGLLALLAFAPALALGQDSSSPSSSSAEPPAAPAMLDDAGLEQAVRAAYTGARNFALAHKNYFTRDGVFIPLREAVSLEIGIEGLGGSIVVAPEPAESIKAASACLPAPGAELRMVPTMFGDGIAIVAVSSTRLFAYSLEPRKAADVQITSGKPCGTAD
jgi:hypothetical protein